MAFLIHQGLLRIHVFSQLCLGKRKVKIGQHGKILLQDVLLSADLLRQVAQDAFHLVLLREDELFDVIVELHDGHRLDEERRACRRLIVNDAWKKAAILRLDGNDVALITQCHDGLLEIFLVLRRPQGRTDALLDAVLCCLDLRAKAPELDAGIISQTAMLVEGIFETTFELAENLDAMRPFLERRRLDLEPLEEFFHAAHRVKRAPDVDEFLQREDSAHVDLLEQRAQIMDTAKRRRCHGMDTDSLRRLLELLLHLRVVCARLQGTRTFLAQRRACARSEHLAYLFVFQYLVGFFFHLLLQVLFYQKRRSQPLSGGEDSSSFCSFLILHRGNSGRV